MAVGAPVTENPVTGAKITKRPNDWGPNDRGLETGVVGGGARISLLIPATVCVLMAQKRKKEKREKKRKKKKKEKKEKREKKQEKRKKKNQDRNKEKK